jgi:SDR family mycofactocin-dependent oxidoreductase
VSKLQGKVAFITGAARGQGRSHAVRLAEEGADIIAVDICRQIGSLLYPLATPEDLKETAAQVEALGRRIITAQADVRDVDALRRIVSDAAAELGGLDIVLANSGIVYLSDQPPADPDAMFREIIDVNLTGVWNTITAAAPIMIEQGRGGSIVLTSSTQGLSGRGGDGGPVTAYAASKHGIVGLMRSCAHWLAPNHIRVNSIHPTGVNTAMATHEAASQLVGSSPALALAMSNLMDVPLVEPIDLSNAIAWLVSDEARYVTGVTLPVDAGFTVK